MLITNYNFCLGWITCRFPSALRHNNQVTSAPSPTLFNFLHSQIFGKNWYLSKICFTCLYQEKTQVYILEDSSNLHLFVSMPRFFPLREKFTNMELFLVRIWTLFTQMDCSRSSEPKSETEVNITNMQTALNLFIVIAVM